MGDITFEEAKTGKSGHITVLGKEIGVNGIIIDFPGDATLRKDYFPAISKSHPAMANIWMIFWLIEKLSKPGETILDPTSGMGTLMVATTLGRNVIDVELEPHFAESQEAAWIYMRTQREKEINGSFTLLKGDTRKILPVKANHVIFSPPYGNILSRPGPKLAAAAIDAGTHISGYGKTDGQIGNLNYFNYLQAMKDVYWRLYLSLPIGGFMCTICKDNVDSNMKGLYNDGLITLSADNAKQAASVGFRLYEWWQRDAQPSFELRMAWKQAEERGRPIPHVTAEDIIIMRKER